MQCAPVVQVTCPSVVVKHFTKRGVKNVSEIDVNEIKNVYEIYKNEFEKENYKNEFDKNESEIKNLSEIYKNEFEIENGRSEFDKNVSEINNEFEVISEGHKIEVAALNVPLGQNKVFNFEDLFKNRHIFKSGSSIKKKSKEYMSLHLNVKKYRESVFYYDWQYYI